MLQSNLKQTTSSWILQSEISKVAIDEDGEKNVIYEKEQVKQRVAKFWKDIFDNKTGKKGQTPEWLLGKRIEEIREKMVPPCCLNGQERIGRKENE